MTATATVRVMSPDEIAARAGGQTPYFWWPQRATVFAERAMRLRQLAAGHALGDYLRFMSQVALQQQAALAGFATVPLPDAAALDLAAQRGVPPLSAVDWPRDPAWHAVLRSMVAGLRREAPPGVAPALDKVDALDAEALEQQADRLLTGVMSGLDLATAPLVAAALQVYWTHLVLATNESHGNSGQPFGRLDDPGLCPCCGSRPVASLARTGGDALGQRYLHCTLCSTQWHLERIKCAHCGSTKAIGYESLDAAGADDETSGQRAAQAAVQAETCDDCGHYLKILHSARDPFVEPVADDLASVSLDLLVSESGKVRHGVNLLLLYGPAAPPEQA